MKRVLVFSTAYFPHVGGAEVAIRELALRLAPEYEFDLICARYEKGLPNKEQMKECTVYRVGVGIRPLDKILSPFLGALTALKLKATHRYDAYWAMMATYGSGGAYIANLIPFVKKVPVVLTLQEGDPPEYLRTKHFGLVALSWKLALARSQSLTVISNYLGKLAQEFGYKKEFALVPNGVDAPKFMTVSQEAVVQAKEKIQKKDGDFLLITTSRLVTKNACDDVIRALAQLPAQVRFIVCGVGPDEPMLRALATELGVLDRVEFLGLVSHTEIPALLHACDAFIRPSRSEGMGNSFIEAMVAGIPVIATQEGGIADFLFDRERNPESASTGFAVDANAPSQIAEQVQNIMTHKEEVRATVQNSIAMVLETYTWDKLAVKMKKVFDEVSKN
jgi:glycosyltransferase involved in cell wall biosynthesis